jgi:type IV pilus assembly protein PilW
MMLIAPAVKFVFFIKGVSAVANERQRGHTLTELMVALAIAGLLLAGVAQAFFANTQTFAVVSEQSQIQENGRLALMLIGNQVGQAGHIQDISPQDFYGTQGRSSLFADAAVDDANISGLHFFAGAFVGGINNLNVADARAQSDAFVLRYQRATGDNLFRDCAGKPLDDSYADHTITIGFYISQNFSLKCVDASGDDVDLVDGIDDMQVLYGVDADGNAPVRADKYLSANEMQPDDWRRVVTVSVALLARAGGSAIAPPRENVTRPPYNVNGELRASDDNIARTVYSQTFQIRNRVF